MVLIGLGTAGTKIVKGFSDMHQKILITKADFPKSCIREEDFEEQCPDFSSVLSFKEEECWFFLCGGSKCSSSSLRLLETIKHKKINVVYVCPDPDITSPNVLIRHKVAFNVLQEYTRSGLLNSICLVSNKCISNMIGDYTINNMYNLINNTISNSIESIEWFKTEEPTLGELHTPKEISRIYTLSIGNIKKSEENMHFLLDNITETCYIYSISKTHLEKNKDLLKFIKAKIAADKENKIISSFAIYPSDHKQSFYYSLKYSHAIQDLE